MATDDPNDPAFDLAAWEAAAREERRRLDEEQSRRDAAWREEFRTRRREKNGPGLAPSFVSVPVPDPEPGAPRFVLVRDPRR